MCFHLCGRMSEYCFLVFALKFSAKSSHFSAEPTRTHTQMLWTCSFIRLIKRHTHTHTHACTPTRAQKWSVMQPKARTQYNLCVCVCVSLINRVINNMRGKDSVSVVVWCFVAGGSCRHTNIPSSNYHLCGHWRLMSPPLGQSWAKERMGTPPLRLEMFVTPSCSTVCEPAVITGES